MRGRRRTDNILVSVPPAVPPPPALTPEHLRQLAEAHRASARIRRAVSIATIDGWSIAAFAVLNCVCGISSISSLLVGAALGAIAFVELRSAGQLRRLEPRALRTLGRNQLALASLLIVYACWGIYAELSGPGAYAAAVASDPELAPMLAPIEGMMRQMAIVTYVGLIGVALLAQGGLALFYFSRLKHLQDYLQHTPGWIIDMQRAGLSI